MNKPKVGDIYRWHWNDLTLKKLNYKRDSGTLYWCCSNICVFKEDNKFWDTYWSGGSGCDSERFSIKEANEKLSLQYIGNFSELIKTNESDRAYYDDKDCVDISHANMSRGGFYLRKDAKKSIKKMKKVMERNLIKLKHDAGCALRRANETEGEIKELTLNSYISIINGVSLSDSSYEDHDV